MADAEDLKSSKGKPLCGFESRPRHLARRLTLLAGRLTQKTWNAPRFDAVDVAAAVEKLEHRIGELGLRMRACTSCSVGPENVDTKQK